MTNHLHQSVLYSVNHLLIVNSRNLFYRTVQEICFFIELKFGDKTLDFAKWDKTNIDINSINFRSLVDIVEAGYMVSGTNYCTKLFAICNYVHYGRNCQVHSSNIVFGWIVTGYFKLHKYKETNGLHLLLWDGTLGN